LSVKEVLPQLVPLGLDLIPVARDILRTSTHTHYHLEWRIPDKNAECLNSGRIVGKSAVHFFKNQRWFHRGCFCTYGCTVMSSKWIQSGHFFISMTNSISHLIAISLRNSVRSIEHGIPSGIRTSPSTRMGTFVGTCFTASGSSCRFS